MSDASLPTAALRQRFDAFIAANTHKKASETDFRRKGSLGVGLIITHTLMSKAPIFPLNPDDFLADAGTQVKNLSGSNINKILKANGIDKSLGTEVGRTNRGAPQHMRVYIEFLNTLQADDALDLPELMGFWLEKVREFFAAKPFELKLDPSLGLRAMVRHLMKQAEDRQRQQQGFNFAGTLAQHLIGAKLDLVLGVDPARHHGANQNDAGGRHGDFLLNDVCIHVTTAPAALLMQKCKENLSHGLRPIIVTIYSRVAVAEALAEDIEIGSMALARLQPMPDAGQQRRVLAGEDRQESGARPQAGRRASCVGLAGVDRVGMRTQIMHAGCHGRQDCKVVVRWSRDIPSHPTIGRQVVKYINPIKKSM